jgi:hypothetical protein
MLDEPADAAEWTGNYLCSMEHFGLRWSAAGPIAGMRCTQISEPEEPAQHGWEDNYLCLPESSPLELRWSASGPIAGLDCTHFNPPRNPHGWKNNFLCYSRQLQTEAQQPVGQ